MKILSTYFFFIFTLTSLSAQSRYDVNVFDETGIMTMPWTGGMNAPQFANIDFNRDGITDLISFDRQGNVLRTYIHLPASGRWEQYWEYENFFPELVDWVQIVDYDKDGVEDLFTSSSNSGVAGVSVYKGAYANDVWTFTQIFDRGKPYLQVPAGGGLTNVYVSWDDIASFNDVDGDGDIDILSFEPGGSYIHYFRNMSVENGWGTDSLRYELDDFCWGKILENELTEEVYLSDDPDICSDGQLTTEDPIIARHAGSTLATWDVDMDGDKDAWVGDITSSHIVFLLNGLNAEDAWITAQEASFPANDTIIEIPYFVAVYFVELDDDPEPELLAAVNSRALAEDRQSVWRYDDHPSTGTLSYKLNEKGWLQNEMIDAGTNSRPAIADINGDGLKDIVFGAYHYTGSSETRIPSLWYFRNTGTLNFPQFQLVTTDYLQMSQFASVPTFDFAPAFGDLDGDGSTDLVVGDQNGKLFYFRNTSVKGDSMVFASPVYPYMNISVGVSATPQIGDINRDGLPDLVIGERTGNSDVNGRCSNLNYFQNKGVVGNPLFDPNVNAAPNTGCFGRVLFNLPVGLPQYSAPSIFETKNGWMLMTGSDPGFIQLYGDLASGITGSFSEIDTFYGELDFGNRSTPVLSDLNDDGNYELLVGNQRGGLELFTTGLLVGTTSIAHEPDIFPAYRILQQNRSIEVVWMEENGESMLLDIYGRVIGKKQSEAAQQYTLDLVPGIYFIRLQINGKVKTEKIVVN